MDEIRIPPAGDPFTSAPDHDDQDRPCACLEGWVYIGHLVEQDGDEVEVFTPIPCRRCADESR